MRFECEIKFNHRDGIIRELLSCMGLHTRLVIVLFVLVVVLRASQTDIQTGGWYDMDGHGIEDKAITIIVAVLFRGWGAEHIALLSTGQEHRSFGGPPLVPPAIHLSLPILRTGFCICCSLYSILTLLLLLARAPSSHHWWTAAAVSIGVG